MHRLFLNHKGNPVHTILCLGSHCDDIEIGCGGTLLKLLQENPGLTLHWVVFSSSPERAREAHESADLFMRQAKKREIVIKEFRNSFFPFAGVEIKEYFEHIKRDVSPDVVFTHYRHDLHQDHRVISDLTWNTFRDHLILEYEIPKYDGDMGVPNVFVHLDEAVCREKIRIIMKCFKSQADKQWFTEDTFLSILRLRGVESNSPGKYAEAFYGRKILF